MSPVLKVAWFRLDGARFRSAVVALFYALLLGATACSKSPPSPHSLNTIVHDSGELRSVTPDGRIQRVVKLEDRREAGEERERILRDFVVSPAPGSRFIGILGYQYDGPVGGGESESRSLRFTYYDDQLNPAWSTNEIGGDPLGNEIRFGDSGKIVLISNATENLVVESTEKSAAPFIVVRNEEGRVLFEKRGTPSGAFSGGVSLSQNGTFVAYGEAADGPITVVNLKTGKTATTQGPPGGASWEGVMLRVSDEGGIVSRIDGPQGEQEWKEEIKW